MEALHWPALLLALANLVNTSAEHYLASFTLKPYRCHGQVARRHAGAYAQRLGLADGALHFVEGRIEALAEAGIAAGSANLVISNCVVNLSPDKRRVLAEAWRALAKGGEMHFADVYCDRRLPDSVRTKTVVLCMWQVQRLPVVVHRCLCSESFI